MTRHIERQVGGSTRAPATGHAVAVNAKRRWAAVVARDERADGEFFYAVKTTGIYCRPSCGARRPRPDNVAFHPTAAAAERAGFRPCKRCRPDRAAPAERRAALVSDLCRLIESSETELSLDALAEHVGLSPSYTHRVFKAVTGVTPKAYATAHRSNRLRDHLHERASITEAIYSAGYNSSARFYEKSNDVLGMTPSQYRSGGADVSIRFAVGECGLGSVLVAATRKGVCAIFLGDDPQQLAHDLERRFPRADLVGADAEFEELVAKVVGLVDDPTIAVDLPLDIRGTVFQQRVWDALSRIPSGTTATYSDIAAAIDAPRSVRGVAQACAANPLAVAIPCHRVVRADGGLGGYRWHVDRKRELLARESASPSAGQLESE